MQRRQFLTLAAASLATPVLARPQNYQLAGSAATIRYTFLLSGAPVTGTVPLSSANLVVDPANLAASTADVTADIRRARTGLLFATQALKSPSVLNANAFPEARFTSTRVQLGPDGRISDGAVLEGDLTLRGQTRPVRFDAGLFRPAGSAADDFSRLRVRLSGTVSRTAFGATGYPDLVEDPVHIDIDAQISAAD